MRTNVQERAGMQDSENTVGRLHAQTCMGRQLLLPYRPEVKQWGNVQEFLMGLLNFRS